MKWLELGAKLLEVVATAAESVGAHDAAARLSSAISDLRTERAETDAIHAATDAKLDALKRREASAGGSVDKRFDPEDL